MTRIAIIADPHIHPFASFATLDADGQNSWVAQSLNVLAAIYSECKGRSVDRIYIAGDLFNVGSRLHTNYWNDVYRFFKLHGKVIPTTIIAGNHDQIKNGSKETLLEGFDQLVEVITSPTRVALPDDIIIQLIPYTEDIEQLRVCLWPSSSVKRQIVIGHLALAGAKVGRFEYVPEGSVPVDLFAGWDEVYLGHYHTHQIIDPKYMYVGSMTSLDFGDADQTKGFVIVELAAGDKPFARTTFIRMPSTRFVIIEDTPEHPQVRDTVDAASVSEAIVRYDYKGQISEDAVRAYLMGLGARAVTFKTLNSTASEVRVVVPNGEDREPTTEEYMAAYVQSQAAEGLDKERLMAVGKVLVAG